MHSPVLSGALITTQDDKNTLTQHRDSSLQRGRGCPGNSCIGWEQESQEPLSSYFAVTEGLLPPLLHPSSSFFFLSPLGAPNLNKQFPSHWLFISILYFKRFLSSESLSQNTCGLKLQFGHKEVSTGNYHSIQSFPKAVAIVTMLVLGPLIITCIHLFVCLQDLRSPTKD